MNLGYVRVSTAEQHEDRQIESLKKYNIDKLFIEKASAKTKDRPIFKQMLQFAREGDTIYMCDFSRMARSTVDLLSITEELKNQNITLISLKENVDTSTPTGKLMLTLIGAINEFERENMLERQRDGIYIAKKKGKYKGRKEVKIENFDEQYIKYKQRKINKTQLAEQLKISRPTLDKLINKYENENKEAQIN